MSRLCGLFDRDVRNSFIHRICQAVVHIPLNADRQTCCTARVTSAFMKPTLPVIARSYKVLAA